MNTPDTEEIIREAVKSVTRDDDGLLDIGKHDHELLSDLLKEVISSRDTYWKENFKQMIQKSRQIKISDNKDITDGWDMALLNLHSAFDHPDAITNKP